MQMKYRYRTCVYSVTVLLLYMLITSPVYAEVSSEMNNVVVDECISSVDFDLFVNGLPVGMTLDIGATTGETDETNLIEQDTCIFVSGNASLRITGNESTTQWRSLSVDIPNDVRYVTVKLFVRGEDLYQESNQYSGCYAGFQYDNLLESSDFEIVTFPVGSFDWTEVTVSFDTEVQFAENVKFVIFSSVSGTLWVDDITFTYDDECENMQESSIHEPLSSYITHLSQPTTFLEMVYCADEESPDSISSTELLEDIEMLKYLLENAYSGYTYWNNQGVDFTAVYDGLTQLADQNDNVSVVDIEHVIANGLAEIQDGHFFVMGHGRHRFLRKQSVYFADVIVEKIPTENQESDIESEYRVVGSNSEYVELGMVYTGAEDKLFRILSRNDVEQFQLGVFTSEYLSEASFQFMNNSENSEVVTSVSVNLPLHECRLKQVERLNDQIFNRTVIDGIDLVRISSFSFNQHEELLKFSESGSALAYEDKFIVDLMGNRGGSSVYGRDFIKNLNGIALWRMYYAMLCSPATIGSIAASPFTEGMPPEYEETLNRMQRALEQLRERPVRNWMYVRDELTDRQMGSYEGCAVFLINRNVASSGEALIDYSKSVPGAVLIGENTAGIGTYGQVLQYWLPNSIISLYLPSKLFLSPEVKEGVGYIPDYWLDSANPVSEVTEWLNNPDSYQFELPEPSILHNLDFESFIDGLPLHIRIGEGARSGNGLLSTMISQDCEIKTGGVSSLKIEGSIDTDRWLSLFQDVPQSTGTLSVEYSIQGEKIRLEGNQFDNCYVGFMYKDSLGNTQFCKNDYEGSFDWRQDSLQLNIDENYASDIQFIIFLSKSGTVWIDDVVFSN